MAAVPVENPISRNTVLVIPRAVESRQRLAGAFARYIINYYEDITAQAGSDEPGGA